MKELAWDIRATAIRHFKLHETNVLLLTKFLVGMIVFTLLFSIGLYDKSMSFLFQGALVVPLLLLCAILFVVLPFTLANTLVVVAVCLQISSSPVVAVYVFLLLFCFLAFYGRLYPKNSFLVLAMVLGYYFKIPYAVVLFAGLYVGLSGIVPVIMGTFIWNFLPLFKQVTLETVLPKDMDLMQLPEIFLSSFSVLFHGITTQTEWMVAGFIFAMVIFAVYAISLLDIDNSRETAIFCGGFLILISFVLAVLILGSKISLFSVFMSGLFSVGLVLVISFFDCVLDYEKAERVQFEDDDNLYVVKIVPKKVLGLSPNNVKHSRTKTLRNTSTVRRR